MTGRRDDVSLNNVSLIVPLFHFWSLGRCVLWIMCPLDDASSRTTRPWKSEGYVQTLWDRLTWCWDRLGKHYTIVPSQFRVRWGVGVERGWGLTAHPSTYLSHKILYKVTLKTHEFSYCLLFINIFLRSWPRSCFPWGRWPPAVPSSPPCRRWVGDTPASQPIGTKECGLCEKTGLFYILLKIIKDKIGTFA